MSADGSIICQHGVEVATGECLAPTMKHYECFIEIGEAEAREAAENERDLYRWGQQ